MKKFFYLMMAFAVTASTLTSCEDVPSPYDNPNNKKARSLLLLKLMALEQKLIHTMLLH